MKYWDSSALVPALLAGKDIDGVTRPHTLSEVFSTFTGKGGVVERDGKNERVKLTAAEAVEIMGGLEGMVFQELTAAETFKAIAETSAKGIRGGAVHDWLHAVAAEKAGASALVTLNTSNFEAFRLAIPLEDPAS